MDNLNGRLEKMVFNQKTDLNNCSNKQNKDENVKKHVKRK